MKRRVVLVAVALVAAGGAVAVAGPVVAFPGTTAWRNGSFVVDTPNLVRRSDIVVGRPNGTPAESMMASPLSSIGSTTCTWPRRTPAPHR